MDQTKPLFFLPTTHLSQQYSRCLRTDFLTFWGPKTVEVFFPPDLVIITSKRMLLLGLKDRIENKVLNKFKKLKNTKVVFIMSLKSKIFQGKRGGDVDSSSLKN